MRAAVPVLEWNNRNSVSMVILSSISTCTSYVHELLSVLFRRGYNCQGGVYYGGVRQQMLLLEMKTLPNPETNIVLISCVDDRDTVDYRSESKLRVSVSYTI